MDRRDFCRSLAGAASAASAFSFGARAAGTGSDPVQAAFESQRAANPWTLGYVGLQADVDPMPLLLLGRLPAELRGSFYRIGPARHALGSMRYHHTFDGDGMLQRYTLRSGGISHQGRFVRTDKFVADSKAGRPVRVAFGTNPPGAEPLTSADAINVANTSIVQHGGELLALWEGGSATRMDPQTLGTRGIKNWSADYAGMPFSAHPKVEPGGTLWNFGVSSLQGLLSIYRIDAGGALVSASTISVPQMTMVHDFAVTERHLVFLLPPLVFDAERIRAGETFLDSHVWRPELGMRVLVLPKDQPDRPQWFDLPAGFVFHVGNAWEDAGGTIRLDYVRSADARYATSGLKDIMQGRHAAPEQAEIALVELDTRSGRARQTLLPLQAEFPRVDPRHVGRRYEQVFVALRPAQMQQRPGFDSVLRLDIGSGRMDRYSYGADVMVEEHLFVPRAGSRAEGDGWLLGTALDLKKQQMLFSVFDAQHLSDGPVAQGALPRVMPLGLHGNFVAAS